MARRHTADTWWWVLVVLLVLWPVMMIFMMPGGPGVIGPFWFWLVLIVALWTLLAIGGREPVPVAEETGPRLLHEPEQPAVVREVMRVDVATEQPEGTRIFRGRLNQPADSAYARLRTALGGDTVPLLQLSLGPALEYGHVLRLSPLAFAGWLGLLVTALNLLPIGQLDGGHIAYSMFGHRIGIVVSTVAMWSLVLLAIFVWPGLTMWAILIFFIAGTAVPPLNDLTPLTPGRTGLGYASFAILLLILMPLPHALWSAAGLYCPYL
jgi:hypothetical protein